MLNYANLIPQLDLSVESLLQQQVIDRNRADCGGFVGRDDAISIGPGEMRHLMWQMRNSERSAEGFRVLVTLMTPVDRTLEIRCGTWSWGAGELV